MSNPAESDLSRTARWLVPFGLILFPFFWVNLVNKVVPEPYLDEVFHVPQAQAYWAHKWSQWDPKLTTPPGLYLVSYLVFTLRTPEALTTDVLRMTNIGAISVLLPWRLQTLLDTIQKTTNTRPLGANLSHTVLNICLFPPLFFFSGLYYTDVLALLFTVEAYNWDLKRDSQVSTNGKRNKLLENLGFLAFALSALICRQTNIFWVAVFLGGLQAVRTIRRSSKNCMSSKWTNIVKQSGQNELYDPPVSGASFEGHKEFHTAEIHLAQMLYIWPYIAFFSWPLFVIPLINILAIKPLPAWINLGFPPKQRKYPRLVAAAIVIPVMLAVVHFNTIVHPFTLADNRHYVFYVFRLLLGVHPAIKYAAVVVYFLCGWAVISAFGFTTIQRPPRTVRIQEPSAPAAAPPAAAAPAPAPAPTPAPTPDVSRAKPKPKPKPAQAHEQPPKGTKRPSKPTKKKGTESASEKKTDPAPEKSADPTDPEVLAKVQQHLLTRQKEAIDTPRVSFVLIWLAATTLSLVTAPLVEPRYFIIPWVMWRLHLPPLPSLYKHRETRPREEAAKRNSDFIINSPKFVEMAWFLIINLVTGYVFLYKGFEWPQEPGKIQRFMW
ncbi:hypothetical protein N7541_003929 [Penicillium brevicompactum]|uniref:Dol-P-Glc:Glc(2)Man(9)GlcNAc(2)-PP-Dol alpha-1,2-glucosyltransferase n=1 Tax=Penicillium brevicompactum TaxID=5074 RepID=A0A9W9V1I9_PENBR|nr:hypothetical protein N7541_003929 [Penicillium brevicompactum]